MRRLAPLAIVLGLAFLGGTAHADTFAVVPTSQAPFVAPALIPNSAGSLVLPAQFSTPPASSAQLSYTQLLGLWQRAGSAYRIPWQVLAAINKVESNFGRNMGPSSAGAIGWMQFMPDTWLRWGFDANGDGVADPWNPDDAIFSAARYLAASNGNSDIYRAVFSYNHADWYVHEVLGLASLYGSDGTIAFSLDRMQQSLAAARAAVVAASAQLVAAKSVVRADGKVVARRQAAVDRAKLLSDRLPLEQQTGLAASRRSVDAALVTARTRALAVAQQELVRAQQQSAAASFAPAASQLFGGPSYSSGYVFPVGGGPGIVFASHSHHDYPAVDIAAPMGSPLYALANAVVLRSWNTIDPSCGIGLTLQAFDGQVWTYCHLSVLDPAVVPGASLVAGQPVGLVGDTGHATGPHLHLQLQPALAWPQREAWFQSFAGTAFTWSDTGANDASRGLRTPALVRAAPAASRPVFQVVGSENPSDGVVYFSSARS